MEAGQSFLTPTVSHATTPRSDHPSRRMSPFEDDCRSALPGGRLYQRRFPRSYAAAMLAVSHLIEASVEPNRASEHAMHKNPQHWSVRDNPDHAGDAVVEPNPVPNDLIQKILKAPISAR